MTIIKLVIYSYVKELSKNIKYIFFYFKTSLIIFHLLVKIESQDWVRTGRYFNFRINKI